MQQHDTTRPVDPKEAGFTLSEVIVTVAIIGLLTLTVGFFFDSISAAFGFGSDLSESERQAREAMDRMAVNTVRNILGVLDGQPNRDNAVNPEVFG